MSGSDRIMELKIENRRLKTQVQDMEDKVLSLVGMISIDSSGGPGNPDLLNEKIIDFINQSQEQINIVSPKIDQFYVTEIKKIAAKGIPVLVITNDRRMIAKEYQKYYDELKGTSGISIINNPNVRYTLVFNTSKAIYSGGSMDKKELNESILIFTEIREKAKLGKIAQIFTSMLPSFMRK